MLKSIPVAGRDIADRTEQYTAGGREVQSRWTNKPVGLWGFSGNRRIRACRFRPEGQAVTLRPGMMITIDGPAGSGKSHVASELARRLGQGYQCLNTGAMYRAVAMLSIRHGAVKLGDWNGDTPDRVDASAVVALAREARLDFDWSATPPTLLIAGKPIDRAELEQDEISRAASDVARLQPVREILVEQQREIGRRYANLISEGRDQGSIVFRECRHKFFLTALVTVRANRRFVQQWEHWRHPDNMHRKKRPEYFEVLFDLIRRDHQDMTSQFGRLVVPEDAVIVDSSDIDGVDKVVDTMIGQITSAGQA
jgi:CMP/dCMP kinase